MPDQPPDRDAAARLTAATRRVIDRVRRSAAETETMDEAAAALERIATLLEPTTHPGPFAQRMLAWDGVFGPKIEAPTDFRDFFPYSPLVGPANPLAPPMDFEVRGDRVFGRVTFGAAYVGPPQNVHGGIIAAAFDELLGSTNVASGVGGMTGTLNVRYEKPTPILEEIMLEGWIDRIEGRKVFTHGEMRHGGVVTARAEGIFIQGSMESLSDEAA